MPQNLFTMNTLNNTQDFSLSFNVIWPIVAFFLALIVSYLCHPIIIKVSRIKNLMPNLNHRSVHTKKITNLGGIGIFLAINLVITLLGNYFEYQKLLNLLGAITLMFFVGLVDDLIYLKPRTKVIAQTVASLYVILSTNLRIENLHGILGMHELPYISSILITTLAFVTLINAYNLIDGVDGLAGSFAITVSLFFGYFFYSMGSLSQFFLSASIAGALVSFLIFNFSKKNKIFMGDTGTMVIGFLLAYQAVCFMSIDFTSSFVFVNSKSLIYFLALFSFPLLDTLRVFVIRLKSGRNPFKADKNHIHHILLKAGLKHWQITVAALLFTTSVVFGVHLFNELEINKLLLVLAAMWIFASLTIANLNYLVSLTKLNTISESISENNITLPEFGKKGKIIYLKRMA